jgi:hypothetical protein
MCDGKINGADAEDTEKGNGRSATEAQREMRNILYRGQRGKAEENLGKTSHSSSSLRRDRLEAKGAVSG